VNASAPIRTPLAQRLAELARGPLAFLVWTGAAAFAGTMLLRKQHEVEVLGLAQGGVHVLSSPCEERLTSLSVTPYQEVRAGDELARFDAADLDARLATALARVEILRAELDAAQLAAEAERQTDGRARADDEFVERRRLAQAEEELALEELDLGVRLATDRIEAERLALGRGRAERLSVEGIGAADVFDEARLAHEAVLERLRQNEGFLAGVRAARAEASTRRAEFERRAGSMPLPPELALGAFPARIRAEELLLAELEVERTRRVLRAPASGRVQAVHASVGQALVFGQPLLTLASEPAEEILAYVPESSGLDLRAGGSALVVLTRAPWTESECVVVAVGPALELLPERLWSTPGAPEYGLPLLARGALSPTLRPGERVRVRFRSAGVP
jgi:multidrug resistance efflux pump